jgi:hypothetical protein
VNMNSGDETVHHTHIVNQILHDVFEREYICAIDEHEEDMNGGTTKSFDIGYIKPPLYNGW